MLCSDNLPIGRVSSHRQDNGFRNIPDIVFDLGRDPSFYQGRARVPGERRTAPHPPQISEQELFPVLIPPSMYIGRDAGSTSHLAAKLSHVCFAQIGAPKAHYGINSDASTPIRMIALSRLVRTKEVDASARMGVTPIGITILAALRALVVRVALAIGINGFSEANAGTLFQLHGSATKYETQYGEFGTLQSRLPWPKFKVLVASLLDALTAARKTGTVGYVVGYRLLSSSPDTPLDVDASTAIASLIEYVEAAMLKSLPSGVSAPSAAYSTLPLPPAPPPTQVPAAAVFNINITQSLNVNLLRLVEHRFHRLLSAPEITNIAAALDEGLASFQTGGTLSEFQVGGEAARRDLLAASMNIALKNKSAMWLWANVIEVTDRPAASVSELANSISEGCKSVAAMLFVDAATAFAD